MFFSIGSSTFRGSHPLSACADKCECHCDRTMRSDLLRNYNFVVMGSEGIIYLLIQKSTRDG
ncbi:hypothetical protein ACE6H2_006350 [Prunus campanulata]